MRTSGALRSAACRAACALIGVAATTGTMAGEAWRPAPNASFQLQFSGEAIDLSVNAAVYDLDLFETDPALIAALHVQGRRVLCYVSVGTREDWRPDAERFPAATVGRDYEQWPGETWLDIRRLDEVGPVLLARFDLARDKGCDGIEPDNLDGYETDSGFPLSRADTVRFVRWLAAAAHVRGLSFGLKNSPDLLGELLTDVDWALIEDCHVQGWCDAMSPARAAGLAVFQVEYTDTALDWTEACAAALRRGFVLILKNRALDAFRRTCS
jgi:hypothetical protein